MRWTTSLRTFVPFVTLVAICMSVRAEQMSTASAAETSLLESEKTVTIPVAKDLVFSNVPLETVEETDKVMNTMAQGEAIGEILKELEEKDLVATPPKTILGQIIRDAIDRDGDGKIDGSDELSAEEMVNEVTTAHDAFMKRNGPDLCKSLMATFQEMGETLQAHDELAKAAESASVMCVRQTIGFTAAGKAMLDTMERYVQTDDASDQVGEVPQSDKAAAHAELSMHLSTLAASEKKEAEELAQMQKEASESVRLQKRNLAGLDLAFHMMTVRQTAKEIRFWAKHIAYSILAYYGMKVTLNVALRETKIDAGHRAASQMKKYIAELPNSSAKKLAAYDTTYDEVMSLLEEGRNPFSSPGLYTVAGVPAKTKYGGGLQTDFVEGLIAEPLFPNMCSSLLEAKRWTPGVTIQPLDLGRKPSFCKGMLLVQVQSVRGNRPEFVKISNMVSSRRKVGQMSLLFCSLINLKNDYTFFTIGMTLWAAAMLVTSPFSLSALVPVAALALSQKALSSGPRFVVGRMMDYARNAAETSTVGALMKPLRQLNFIGQMLKRPFQRHNATPHVATETAPKAAAVAAPHDEEEDDDEDFVLEDLFDPKKGKKADTSDEPVDGDGDDDDDSSDDDSSSDDDTDSEEDDEIETAPELGNDGVGESRQPSQKGAQQRSPAMTLQAQQQQRAALLKARLADFKAQNEDYFYDPASYGRLMNNKYQTVDEPTVPVRFSKYMDKEPIYNMPMYDYARNYYT